MKKSFILILLFALSSNIYSQKFEIPEFQEGMNKMENLARKTVKKIIKRRGKAKSETYHFLIVPYIYPANRYMEDGKDVIAYTDSLLGSGGVLTGEFPRAYFVEYYLYNDKKEFICSGEVGSKVHAYRKNVFDAIIALNPEFTFKPYLLRECYYVFSENKIYKLDGEFNAPLIVTLLYTSPK